MTPTSSLCATGLASPEPRLLGGRGPAAAASHLRHRGHGKSGGGPAGPARSSRAGKQAPHGRRGPVSLASLILSRFPPARWAPASLASQPFLPAGLCMRRRAGSSERLSLSPIPLLPSLLRGSSQPVVSVFVDCVWW